MKKLLMLIISCCILLFGMIGVSDAKADIPSGIKDHYNYDSMI